ncbi:MAG: hypothetical protein Kow0081_3600 [Candidatus Dojkabacteria bacterium]
MVFHLLDAAKPPENDGGDKTLKEELGNTAAFLVEKIGVPPYFPEEGEKWNDIEKFKNYLKDSYIESLTKQKEELKASLNQKEEDLKGITQKIDEIKDKLNENQNRIGGKLSNNATENVTAIRNFKLLLDLLKESKSAEDLKKEIEDYRNAIAGLEEEIAAGNENQSLIDYYIDTILDPYKDNLQALVAELKKAAERQEEKQKDPKVEPQTELEKKLLNFLNKGAFLLDQDPRVMRLGEFIEKYSLQKNNDNSDLFTPQGLGIIFSKLLNEKQENKEQESQDISHFVLDRGEKEMPRFYIYTHKAKALCGFLIDNKYAKRREGGIIYDLEEEQIVGDVEYIEGQYDPEKRTWFTTALGYVSLPQIAGIQLEENGWDQYSEVAKLVYLLVNYGIGATSEAIKQECLNHNLQSKDKLEDSRKNPILDNMRKYITHRLVDKIQKISNSFKDEKEETELELTAKEILDLEKLILEDPKKYLPKGIKIKEANMKEISQVINILLDCGLIDGDSKTSEIVRVLRNIKAVEYHKDSFPWDRFFSGLTPGVTARLARALTVEKQAVSHKELTATELV